MSSRTMASRLQPFWSQGKVERELGVTGSALLELVRERRVLGLTTSDGVLIFPTSQFERVAGLVRVRALVQTMISVLSSHDEWSVALLLEAPADELGGLSPLQAAREQADLANLFAYIHVVNSDWTSPDRPRPSS